MANIAPFTYASRNGYADGSDYVMKRDVIGEYVANVVERHRDTPRSLPTGSLLGLYFLPPNSRYVLCCGLLFIAFEVLMFLPDSSPHPVTKSAAETIAEAIMMGLVGLVILAAFAWPLRDVRRLSYAIKFGVIALGRTDKVLYSQPGAVLKTYAGMTSGAIMATISYTFNGLQRTEELYLDQPWVRTVVQGTQLRLLVDPDKSTILYVIGIAAQPPETNPPPDN